MATLYFNNAVNDSYEEAGNVWTDAGCTVAYGSAGDFMSDNITVVSGAVLDRVPEGGTFRTRPLAAPATIRVMVTPSPSNRRAPAALLRPRAPPESAP